jgi:hypothetical protein
MSKEEVLIQFKQVCTSICSSVPTSYHWQWDTRFNVALVVIDKRDMPVVLPLISQKFNQTWNDANIDTAPSVIMDVINDNFGIQPGQILFNSDDKNDLILLAAWWPWGNGVNISLRIGLFQPKHEVIGPTEAEQFLREWFTI